MRTERGLRGSEVRSRAWLEEGGLQAYPEGKDAGGDFTGVEAEDPGEIGLEGGGKQGGGMALDERPVEPREAEREQEREGAAGVEPTVMASLNALGCDRGQTSRRGRRRGSEGQRIARREAGGSRARCGCRWTVQRRTARRGGRGR